MIEIFHECYRQKDLRWRSRFHLMEVAGGTGFFHRVQETRREVSFATQEEAMAWNRELALLWTNANCPDVEVFQRRAQS